MAHRLSTVADMDLILVLDQGFLVEYGTPNELLQNGSGVFRKMVDALGTNYANQIKELAKIINCSKKTDE